VHFSGCRNSGQKLNRKSLATPNTMRKTISIGVLISLNQKEEYLRFYRENVTFRASEYVAKLARTKGFIHAAHMLGVLGWSEELTTEEYLKVCNYILKNIEDDTSIKTYLEVQKW
jgi:hypothetical protein